MTALPSLRLEQEVHMRLLITWLALQPIGLFCWHKLTHSGRGCCDA